MPFRPDFVSSYAVDRIATVIEEKRRLEDVLTIPYERRRYIALVNFWRDGNFQRLNFTNVAAMHPTMATAIPQDDGIAEAFEYRGERLSIEEKYGSGAEVVRALCKEAVDSIIMTLPERDVCMSGERQAKILIVLHDLLDASRKKFAPIPLLPVRFRRPSQTRPLPHAHGAGPPVRQLTTLPARPPVMLDRSVMSVLRDLPASPPTPPPSPYGRERRHQGNTLLQNITFDPLECQIEAALLGGREHEARISGRLDAAA